MSDKNEPERENFTDPTPQSSVQTSGSKKRRKREDTSFQCPQCQRVFGRIEHLRRHATSHGEERSYKCVICGKGFNRLDTLQRHELIHQKGAGVSKFKGARACKECASAKVRCNGTLPCERCSTKGTECFYPNATSPAPSPSSAIQETASTPEAGPSEPESYSMLESATFPQQLERSLPYVEEQLPFHDPENIYSPGVWAHATSPDWTQAGVEYTMHPILQRTISHESGSQQSVFSPAGLPFSSGEVFSAMHPLQLDDENDAMESLARRWSINSTRRPSSILDSENPLSQAISGTGEDTKMYVRNLRKQLVARGSFSTSLPSATNAASRKKFNFPVLRLPHQISKNGTYALLELLSEENYVRIHRAFNSLCVGITAQAPAFETSNLPSRQTLNAFVQLYLEHFHPLMPVLHQPSIRMNRSHWLLSLALAAVGSQYADFEHASEYSTSLIEFLRRVTSSLDTVEEIDEVISCQVRLLSCICLMYSGDESCQRDAQIQFSDLVSFCRSNWRMRNLDFVHTLTEIDQAESYFWSKWTMVESWHRTGYMIWLLDAMWAYQFQIQTRLSLGDGTVPLPCPEVLWESASATQWRAVLECSPENPTLISAVQLVHDKPQSQVITGELSRIILIHGLYHRNWEVEKYILDSQGEVWLPQVPMYQQWRESACNSIDILHWNANNVANASGVEHPTILHLHSARIILLAPSQEICNLAYGVTKEDPNITSTQITELRRSIRRWATEDDFKARLAAVHAGAIFRHLRQFPTGGFHEPSAIFLATLTLWAYGSFSRTMTTTTTTKISAEIRSSNLQTFPSITLDQQIDPELAQLFVKNGSGMATTITGVGDIRGDGGSEQIFLEGSKLVLQTSKWGSGRKVMRILNNLSLCRQYVEPGEAGI